MARAFAFVSSSLLEANLVQTGVMHNSVYDLSILRTLRAKLCSSKAPWIIPFFWALLLLGWLKINMDGVAMCALGFAGGGGGIVCNRRGFVWGVFSILVGDAFAYKAKLCATLHAIEKAQKFSWDQI